MDLHDRQLSRRKSSWHAEVFRSKPRTGTKFFINLIAWKSHHERPHSQKNSLMMKSFYLNFFSMYSNFYKRTVEQQRQLHVLIIFTQNRVLRIYFNIIVCSFAKIFCQRFPLFFSCTNGFVNSDGLIGFTFKWQNQIFLGAF